MLKCHHQYTFTILLLIAPPPGYTTFYCTPCLVVARFTDKKSITEHIALCPAILDQCPEVEHEHLIKEYKQKEAEIEISGKYSEKNNTDNNDNLPPHLLSTPTSNSSAQCSNTSSRGPYYRTNPEDYCQKCKIEVSEVTSLQLPRPVQFRDFITECTSPWLHYGYCTSCLEAARYNGTEIVDHITQCDALYGNCWEGEHESHIEHYQRTEAENATPHI